MLPTFIVIGAAKAGTTSLYEYLRLHPDVFMSEQKELWFFVEDAGWPRGVGWYEAQFADAGGAAAIGEASPGYTMFPAIRGVPERMAGIVPDAKLIYLVRDPVKRIVSAYQHRVREARERRPPEEALTDPFYINPTRYAFQLEQYRDHFPGEQILVVPTESLATDPLGTLTAIADFVGVAPTWSPEILERHHNVAQRIGTPRRSILLAHRVPGVRPLRRALRRRLPTGTKEAIKRLTHLEPPPVEVSDRLRGELEARLRDDVAALREQWLGPEFDGWSLLGAAKEAVPRRVH